MYFKGDAEMAYKVDFKQVSTVGLESSPVADALAGLRANEARYFWNKYKHEFITVPAAQAPETITWINTILKERDMQFRTNPLEVSEFQIDDVKWAYIFYENGLCVNVLYTITEGGKRAVGFKLSDGMDIPKEFEGKFKFARQKSKLAGTIRGSFFVIKGEY
jgi:hypothetical protein